jgi:hypothetical protein
MVSARAARMLSMAGDIEALSTQRRRRRKSGRLAWAGLLLAAVTAAGAPASVGPQASVPQSTVAAPATPSIEPLTLAGVMDRVGQYVETYGEQLAVVVGKEDYSQNIDRTSPDGTRTRVARRIQSEIALVRAGGDWMGFRDVHLVDGKPTEGRTDRLLRLFSETPGEAIGQGRRIADESARHNLGAIQRNFNTPTTALFFLQPKTQGRFRFTKQGEDRTDGVPTWRIGYQETATPPIVRTSAGIDMPCRGSVWVVPETGAVLRTDMEIDLGAQVVDERSAGTLGGRLDTSGRPIDSPQRRAWSSRALVSVTYRMDQRLALLAPAEMRESYGPQESPLGERSTITCRAIYSDLKRFETSGKLVVPK